MDVGKFTYFSKYQQNLDKFIFSESGSLSNKDYIRLTDESRRIKSYLNKHQN